ncbi:unnamed protein product [Porites lobata]|uniref:Uncharacterized protein n=1 Tax=Porites lobata TaxID=104759 RepID=A0ABN8R1M6_9CNID|nr:unnamed protein product [Porites lobata]
MHRKLAQRINVKIEETQGLDMCTVSVHNMLHIHEDIINFSATDNYWCAVFERAVKDYIKRSNNCNNYLILLINQNKNNDCSNNLLRRAESINNPDRALCKLIGVVRSVEMARAICRKDGQHSLLLGSSKRVCQLTRDDHIKIAAALSLSPTEISAVPTITKKCFLINVKVWCYQARIVSLSLLKAVKKWYLFTIFCLLDMREEIVCCLGRAV